MREGNVWLLYGRADYALNRDYAALMQHEGEALRMRIEPVLVDELLPTMDAAGVPGMLRGNQPARPAAVLSRQRDSLLSEHFERMGVPVFNGSRVCAICNDKRRTHQFLQGLPMPDTVFLPHGAQEPPPNTCYPVVLKPACSHGGDRVTLVRNAREWQEAAMQMEREPAMQQRVVANAGRDLRVYVVFGEIVAGVLRTAREGIVSNFKLGGEARLHALTLQERTLAKSVVTRFAQAGAPLCMAGVDLLYGADGPVVGEVEDVVGSRMLYQTSDINIVRLFLQGVRERLLPCPPKNVQ
ncbi:MAG: ATP-grasp domain-containing protein [Clostridia bacterium]